MTTTSRTVFKRAWPGPRTPRVVYPLIEAWELLNRRQREASAPVEDSLPLAAPAADASESPLPEVTQSTAPARVAAVVALPVGDVQWLDWPQDELESAPTAEVATAPKGNHAVQPEVTRGTMNSVFPVSGVDMEDRPASTRPRAFARTEVAGLDESFGDHPVPAPVAREEGGSSGFSTSVLPALTAEHLNPEGERWLKALPVAVRPLITAKRHPHIVNKMARLWDRRDALGAYMDELLISSRPGRRGFAMEVLEELVDLQRALQERGRI